MIITFEAITVTFTPDEMSIERKGEFNYAQRTDKDDVNRGVQSSGKKIKKGRR